MAETQTYNYFVPMSCDSCSKSVTKILNKLKDQSDGAFESFDIVLADKHVTAVAKPKLEKAIFETLDGRFKDGGVYRADKDWNEIPKETPNGDEPKTAE